MQTKNSFFKIMAVMTALVLFTAMSTTPAFAQSGMGGSNRGTQDTDRGTTGDTLNQRGIQDKDGVYDRNGDQKGTNGQKDQMGQIGQPGVGMTRYLVMIPDAGDNCQDVMREFSSTMPMQRDGAQGQTGTQGRTGTPGTPGTDNKTPTDRTQQGTMGTQTQNVSFWQWGRRPMIRHSICSPMPPAKRLP